jgi:Zn-dependent alcohol dehydrogenase
LEYILQAKLDDTALPQVTPGHESAGIIERVGEYVPLTGKLALLS